MNRQRGTLLALVVAACAPAPARAPVISAAPASAPAPSAAAPEGPAVREVDGLPAITLPVTANAEPIPDDAYPILIDGSRVYLGSPATPVLELPAAATRGVAGFGADSKKGSIDLFVGSLANAVEARACDSDGTVPDAAVVYADGSLEYRVLLEALFTLHQIDYQRLYVATRREGIPADTRSNTGIRAQAGKRAALDLTIRANRLDLWWSTHAPKPEACAAAEGPASTRRIPRVAGGFDLAVLDHCVSATLKPEDIIHIAAEGELPISEATSLAARYAAEHPVGFAAPAPEPKPVVSGPVSDNARVVARMRGGFRNCFVQALKQDKSARGTIQLTIRIGPKGGVDSVSVSPSGNLPSTTTECVRSVAAKGKFPPPVGGSAIVQVPLRFVPNDSGDPTPPEPKRPACGVRSPRF